MSTGGDHGREAGSLNSRDKESWNRRSPVGKSSVSVPNGLYRIIGIFLVLLSTIWIRPHHRICALHCQVSCLRSAQFYFLAALPPAPSSLSRMPTLQEGAF